MQSEFPSSCLQLQTSYPNPRLPCNSFICRAKPAAGLMSTQRQSGRATFIHVHLQQPPRRQWPTNPLQLHPALFPSTTHPGTRTTPARTPNHIALQTEHSKLCCTLYNTCPRPSAKDGTIDIRTEEAQDMIHLYCCDNPSDRQVQPTQPTTDRCNQPSFRRPRLKLTAWHLDGLQLLLDLRLLQVHGHLPAALHELFQDTVRQLRHHLL